MGLKLYFYERSRAYRVRWALEELETPYEVISVDSELMESEDYRKIHPLGLVPALVDDATSVFETGAICIYLADKFQKLAPLQADLKNRAKFYQWMFFAVAEFDKITADVAFYLDGSQRTIRQDDAKDVLENFKKRAEVLSAHLAESEFMLGAEFSMIDILIASVLSWAQSMRLLSDYPRLIEYREKMQARPAAQRARGKV